MRDQPWYILGLLGLTCLIRAGLAGYGYLEPVGLMAQLGAPLGSNPQMPYIVRVWAIRDIVIAVLVITATPQTIRKLVAACIAIDLTDVMSAHLAGASGLFSASDTWSLKATAIAALIPETIALLLILRRDIGKNA